VHLGHQRAGRVNRVQPALGGLGGDGVRQALLDEGFQVTSSAQDGPVAVVQGWDPAVDWALLSEGVYAINAGALHVATNLDATLPTERGFALGNGSLVAAVVLTTGAWTISAYPLAVETLAAQTGRFLGFAWLAFQALSRIKIHGITVIEWAGILTPGGETREHYQPRHEAA